jgi:hypothetical protein
MNEVKISLKLDSNYRKVKELIENALKDVTWIKKLEVKIAPKVCNLN